MYLKEINQGKRKKKQLNETMMENVAVYVLKTSVSFNDVWVCVRSWTKKLQMIVLIPFFFRNVYLIYFVTLR